MTRPGLIVGLGGTGQWVLTWLKRDLLLSNNGVMPNNVRLLSLDTSTQLEAGAARITSSTREEGAEVGGVVLDKSEFIYVGGDSRPLAERVKAGKLPQIGKWYHANRWLDSQAPAAFILDDGAGRIRQFGRMAVYKDILGQEAGSQLWRAFQSAMDAIGSMTSEQSRLEINVVGSFAGGTGSGMFLDVALILRLIAQQKGVHHVLRGIFALPGVFTNSPSRTMKAHTFAAWRELNRFMVINSDFPMPTIEYVENNSNFRIRPNQRIFDACYLVDGTRNKQPLAGEAKSGVFPMVAEMLSAILDSEAGQAYTNWVFTNLAPEYAKRPDTPMYSVTGAYTVQVPAHFVQEVSSHQFSQDLLLSLLMPKSKPDEFDRLAASGAQRHLDLAAPDRNQEDRGYAGSARSRRILTNPVSYAGKNTKPTLFFGRIATLNDTIASGDIGAVAQNLMEAGDKLSSKDAWAVYYPDLGDDPQFEKERQEIETFMRYNTSQYARREGEKPQEVRARLQKISADIYDRFGGTLGTDDAVEEFHGQFGEALRNVQHVQMVIFRQMVLLNLLDILMGRDDNALIARSGKLGYAWDFFDGVVQELNRFISLLDEVNKKRLAAKPEVKLRGLVKQAEGMMIAMTEKRFLLFFEHPDVKKSEDQYLRHQQRVINLRREDVLHKFVDATARQMKAVAEEARDMLQTWIWHLSTGDDASQLPGIWDGISRSKQELRNAHSFDKKIDTVQRLLSDEPLVADQAELANALRRWVWLAEYRDIPPRLHLTAQILPTRAEEAGAVLEDPTTASSPALSRTLGEQNRNKLLALSRRSYSGVVARSTVAQAIKDTYPTPADFVADISDALAAPMFDGDPEASPVKRSNLIRVRSDANDSYFYGETGLEGLFRRENQLDPAKLNDTYGIQVVGSEHPYKLTMVRTNDLITYDRFAAWETCMDAYAEHLLEAGDLLMDPVLLHNFPAEAQAVTYERRLAQEPYNRPYKPLHPRVVMLLEDPEALRQFLYLGMLGMIGEVDSRREYHWTLTWEKTTGPQTFWLTKAWNEDKDKGQRPKPDIFSAMHGYIIMRRTQQRDSQATIDIEFADRLIQREMSKLGLQGELEILEQNLKQGLVQMLEEQAFDPDVPDRIIHHDYRDLALVVEMVLNDRILAIKDQMERDKRRSGTSGRSRNPFKTVYDVNDEGKLPDGS